MSFAMTVAGLAGSEVATGESAVKRSVIDVLLPGLAGATGGWFVTRNDNVPTKAITVGLGAISGIALKYYISNVWMK